MGLRLMAVGGSGRELGLDLGLRYRGGFRLGLRLSVGYASLGYANDLRFKTLAPKWSKMPLKMAQI